MKKIGRQVLFLEAKEGNPRNGEGSFLRIDENTIMYAYSKYEGNDWNDHCPADIYAIYSYDEGETWQDERLIVKHDSTNVMCASLLRFDNGDIGAFYLKKENETCSCVVYMVRSSDNGKTWPKPVRCINEDKYFVTNNDRVIKLKNGRILIPANFHPFSDDNPPTPGKFNIKMVAKLDIFASDDDGYTWYKLAENIEMPEKDSGSGLQESGLYQRETGEIVAWSRTDMGFQYECISYDNGKSWTTPHPKKFFTSPLSPMSMKRVCGDKVVAVFNPIPSYTTRELTDTRTWGRTPYVCAVSADDGNKFDKIFVLEDDDKNGYCYAAIFDGGDYFLVAYYHSNNSEGCLNSNKMIKVRKEELE